jgi:hypothetical protein
LSRERAVSIRGANFRKSDHHALAVHLVDLAVAAAWKRRQRAKRAVLPNGGEAVAERAEPAEILAMHICARSFRNHRN